MPVSPLLIQTVNLPESQIPAIRQLACLAFGEDGYLLETAADLSQALEHPDASGHRLLVLAAPDKATLQRAEQARDGEELPLWAIIAYGSTPDTRGFSTISESEPVSETAATILRLALQSHRMARRSERARGDLLTISTRICHDLRSPLNTLQTAVYLLVSTDLSPDYPKKEISEPALNSLSMQNNLISRLSLLTEASGEEVACSPVKVEQAFVNALDKVRSVIESSGGEIDQPQQWPTVQGVQLWIEAAWESLILSFLNHRHSEKRLSIGWEDTSDGFIKFWIRSKFTGEDPTEQGIHLIPFNLLHRHRDSRDLGVPIAHRLVQLQGGRSKVAVDGNGVMEFSFELAAAQ